MPLEAGLLTRRYVSPRKFMLLLATLAAAIVLLICLCRTLNLHDSPSTLLGVADNIYVISLRNRNRRREDMEKLRLSLELHWTYVDALEADNPLAHRIMDWVEALRTGPPHILNERNCTPNESRLLPDAICFAWPADIETHVTSRAELDLWSTGIWPSPTSFKPARYSPVPVACATENYNLTEHAIRPKEHLILTYPRIACWHSHLIVIHDIANNAASDTLGVAIILEDDVDMEKDIHKQLAYLWLSLPTDWDIVFLGHCWSDETGHGLQSPLDHTINNSSVNSHLYIARKPKCTHAYALSRTGARRLLLHLRYPPFAYSRAIDQAISWLVESGRLKGFSVVPSVVIQRKVTESDVIPGTGMGSRWKDNLMEGVFEDSRLEIV